MGRHPRTGRPDRQPRPGRDAGRHALRRHPDRQTGPPPHHACLHRVVLHVHAAHGFRAVRRSLRLPAVPDRPGPGWHCADLHRADGRIRPQGAPPDRQRRDVQRLLSGWRGRVAARHQPPAAHRLPLDVRHRRPAAGHPAPHRLEAPPRIGGLPGPQAAHRRSQSHRGPVRPGLLRHRHRRGRQDRRRGTQISHEDPVHPQMDPLHGPVRTRELLRAAAGLRAEHLAPAGSCARPASSSGTP